MGDNEDALIERFRNLLLNKNSQYGNVFREENRLKTFANWKHDFLDKYELAMLGYVFLEPPDTICCIFCGSRHREFEPYDKAFIFHFQSPKCPLLNFLAYENVPLDPEKLDHALLSASYDTCSSCNGHVLRIDRYDRKWEVHLTENRDFNFKMDIKPLYPQYDTILKRHKTYQFCGWKYKKNPEELTEPGFFYTKKNDKVTCFCCGVSVSGWKVEDCPWEIHAYASENCEYLRKMKGQVLIDHARLKFANMADILKQRITVHPSTSSSTASVQKSTRTTAGSSTFSAVIEASGGKTCNICLDREYNMAFLPCGHVVTCEECAGSLSTCPVCRKSITSKTKVFLG